MPGKEQDILLTVGVGQEPRLGRWLKVKEGARNSTIIYALTRSRNAGESGVVGAREADHGDVMSEDEKEA